jgi:hypothetical protein
MSFPTIPADADVLNHSTDARRGCAPVLGMLGREGGGGCRPPWHGRFAAGQSPETADQTRVAFVGPEPRALSYLGVHHGDSRAPDESSYVLRILIAEQLASSVTECNRRGK